jgi:hypothetical protein
MPWDENENRALHHAVKDIMALLELFLRQDLTERQELALRERPPVGHNQVPGEPLGIPPEIHVGVLRRFPCTPRTSRMPRCPQTHRRSAGRTTTTITTTTSTRTTRQPRGPERPQGPLPAPEPAHPPSGPSEMLPGDSAACQSTSRKSTGPRRQEPRRTAGSKPPGPTTGRRIRGVRPLR